LNVGAAHGREIASMARSYPRGKLRRLRSTAHANNRGMSVLELRIPPVLVTVIFAALIWLVSRITPGIDLPATLRIACLLLFASAGAVIGLSGVVAFKKARTTVNPFTPEASALLVDSGVFRFTRNPMYLALLLGLSGWAVFLDNMYSLALTAA